MEIEKNGHSSDHLWAVVDSGTRRLVGKLADLAFNADSSRLSEAITVHEALTLHCQSIKVMTPQGPGYLYEPNMTAVDGADDAVDITVRPSSIRRFSEMDDNERNAYKAMRENVLENLQRNRLARLGITQASQVPKGGLLV
jgi:hypothetical protein